MDCVPCWEGLQHKTSVHPCSDTTQPEMTQNNDGLCAVLGGIATQDFRSSLNLQHRTMTDCVPCWEGLQHKTSVPPCSDTTQPEMTQYNDGLCAVLRGIATQDFCSSL